MILFRCLAKCFPTFPIKVGSKQIFFIQIITPELYHILLKNVILFSRPIHYRVESQQYLFQGFRAGGTFLGVAS